MFFSPLLVIVLFLTYDVDVPLVKVLVEKAGDLAHVGPGEVVRRVH
jgi:hypothetical protein